MIYEDLSQIKVEGGMGNGNENVQNPASVLINSFLLMASVGRAALCSLVFFWLFLLLSCFPIDLSKGGATLVSFYTGDL